MPEMQHILERLARIEQQYVSIDEKVKRLFKNDDEHDESFTMVFNGGPDDPSISYRLVQLEEQFRILRYIVATIFVAAVGLIIKKICSGPL